MPIIMTRKSLHIDSPAAVAEENNCQSPCASLVSNQTSRLFIIKLIIVCLHIAYSRHTASCRAAHKLCTSRFIRNLFMEPRPRRLCPEDKCWTRSNVCKPVYHRRKQYINKKRLTVGDTQHIIPIHFTSTIDKRC